jgi:superfamily I DNA/RNA helicase
MVLNHGSAKVPGADKNKKCTPDTLSRRRAVEAEVAALWDNVTASDRLWNCLDNLPATSSADLKLARDILKGLLESFTSSKGKRKGEFAKCLSLAVGVWTEPERLVDDLCSIDKLLSFDQPIAFGAVQLITMRKAKGLEADFVIMVGLEDDIIPNRLSPIDEQARLFYVSMTRAKEALYMIHAFKRRRNISFGPEITNKKRSRFLDAIGEESVYKR